MINALIVALSVQSPSLAMADQDWTLSLTTVGKFGTPIGILKDPILSGIISVQKSKEPIPKKETYRLKFALKRTQSKLITAVTDTFPDQKDTQEAPTAIYKDKDFAYFINTYSIGKTDFKIEAKDHGDYSPPAQVLNPLSMALVIAQRSLNKPDLRKEYPVLEDGPRKFFVTFRPNLNANTDSVPGDVAFKFDLKLKDEEGEYPSFFSGAIRLNTKTCKVQYITAVSDPEHQPKGPDDASLGGGKSYALRLEAKIPKEKPKK